MATSTPRSLFSVTLGLALALAGTMSFSACDDDDDDGGSGGDTASQADGGGDGGGGDDTCGGGDGGGDGDVSAECQNYITCVDTNCDDCLDVCSDYIDCAAGCGCGADATQCQTDCLTNQSADCTSCFTMQGLCVAENCSEELMACGMAG